VLAATAQKESTELIAAGDLRKALNHAEGVLAEGTSIAESERLKQLATVTAQVTLADKIADSAAYQTYLVSIEQVAAARDVGIEQAKALQTLNQNADIKMIINTGEGGTQSGMKSLMDIFTPKGGTTLGAAVEAFAQTPTGEALLSKVLPEKTDTKDVNLKKTFKNV
jgi:flotillin